MTLGQEVVKRNSSEIERLRSRIDETVRLRSRSRMDRDAWAKACEDFHVAYGELFFPGGEPHWAAFVAGENDGIEAAIVFLEADPYFFRSGYLKQQIWHRLKRTPQSVEQTQRIEATILSCLRKPTLREFWSMARYVRYRGTDLLWDSIDSLAACESSEEGRSAYWLTLARRNFPVRKWVGREFRHARRIPGYVPQLRPEIDKNGRLLNK